MNENQNTYRSFGCEWIIPGTTGCKANTRDEISRLDIWIQIRRQKFLNAQCFNCYIRPIEKEVNCDSLNSDSLVPTVIICTHSMHGSKSSGSNFIADFDLLSVKFELPDGL